MALLLETLVPLGKNQFPRAPFSREGWQQAVRLVTQSRASSSPMSSRVTILLFWYVVPLSENLTSPIPGKERILMFLTFYVLESCRGNRADVIPAQL